MPLSVSAFPPALVAVARFLRRVLIAEALTIAVLVASLLLGLPAIICAFNVALVEFLASLWLALVTFWPLVAKLWKGAL